MNIFYLHHDQVLCAQQHCDKHVVKMITETAQLLSSAYYSTGQEAIAPYLKSHYNHPSAIWARSCIGNWLWLWRLGVALYREYTHRYGNKHHKGGETILLMGQSVPSLPCGDFTPPPQCMPLDCKTEDTVVAYHNYYNRYKRHLFSWRNRNIPNWIER